VLIIPEYAFGALCRTDEIRLSGPTAAAVVIAEIGGGHEPVPHRRTPGLLGGVHPHSHAIRQEGQGPNTIGHGNRYLV
jgi:hypothetical protein